MTDPVTKTLPFFFQILISSYIRSHTILSSIRININVLLYYFTILFSSYNFFIGHILSQNREDRVASCHVVYILGLKGKDNIGFISSQIIEVTL